MIKDPTILRDSNNPRELVDTARHFAASPALSDQQVLAKYLDSTTFLDKLDPPEAYQVFQPHQLRAARIVRTLMDNNTPAGRQTLVGLTTSKGFLSYDLLVVFLIQALAVDRPASDLTLTYWQKYLHPDSVYADNVVDAILENRSRPALDLFEHAMNDPSQDSEHKYVWLRDSMLRRRNDPEVLACCERMILLGTVDPDWHETILEAVFDYDPSWYLTDPEPRPPLRILAPEPSKSILEKLALYAIHKMKLSNTELKLKIRMAMKEIGKTIDDEEGDGNATI